MDKIMNTSIITFTLLAATYTAWAISTGALV